MNTRNGCPAETLTQTCGRFFSCEVTPGTRKKDETSTYTEYRNNENPPPFPDRLFELNISVAKTRLAPSAKRREVFGESHMDDSLNELI